MTGKVPAEERDSSSLDQFLTFRLARVQSKLNAQVSRILRAHADIATILKDFDIILMSPEDAVASGLSAVFYPHGLGHFLGLQTHDVAGLIADADGTPIPRPDGHPFLRLTRTLEEGNVLTIEPGLYFIEPLLRKWRENGDVAAINWDRVAELAPFGGIRIEDDVLVTKGGHEILSKDVPKKPDEIEQLMQAA